MLTCRAMQESPAALVRRHLFEPRHAWSVGTYGALAEFDYEADEPGLSIDRDTLAVRSGRGSLTVHGIEAARPFALEDGEGRVRQIAFCTDRPGARRDCITALGERTFDVGIAAPHIDVLVRIAPEDEETLVALQASTGKKLLGGDNSAGAAIVRGSPTRILVSAIARLEVHQPIPPPGGRSPRGPHTHLLPKLLAKGRTHAPNISLPDGLYFGLFLYFRGDA
jgi:hypothetical protein